MDRRSFFRGAGAATAAVAVAPAVRLVSRDAPTLVLDHAANAVIIDELAQRDLNSAPIRGKISDCPRCFKPGYNTRVGMGGQSHADFGVVHICRECDVTWKA